MTTPRKNVWTQGLALDKFCAGLMTILSSSTGRIKMDDLEFFNWEDKDDNLSHLKDLEFLN